MLESDILRALTEYLSGKVPLPPEIAMNRAGGQFFRMRAMAELYGVQDHPVYQIFERNKVMAGMALAIDHGAEYSSRIAHILAKEGFDPSPEIIETTEEDVTETPPTLTSQYVGIPITEADGTDATNHSSTDTEPGAGVEGDDDLTNSQQAGDGNASRPADVFP